MFILVLGEIVIFSLLRDIKIYRGKFYFYVKIY